MVKRTVVAYLLGRSDIQLNGIRSDCDTKYCDTVQTSRFAGLNALKLHFSRFLQILGYTRREAAVLAFLARALFQQAI